jgi:hypothetical protein
MTEKRAEQIVRQESDANNHLRDGLDVKKKRSSFRRWEGVGSTKDSLLKTRDEK